MLFSVAVAVSMVGPLLARGAPVGRVECRFDATTHVVSLTLASLAGDPSEARIRRVGEGIEIFEPRQGSMVSCGKALTVSGTERVEILTEGISHVEIDLEGGLFAPEAGIGADLSPQVEFTLAGSGIVTVKGGPGADHFQYLTAGGRRGVNLNPGPGDRDIDLAFLGKIQNLLPIYAEGGPGPDTIETVGHSAFGMIADGGGGNDTLRASGAAAAVLDGGSGRDRILGSPRADILSPESGPDAVDGLSGGDLVNLSADRSRDTINCGDDDDATGRPDRFDRLRSCEKVDGGGRR